MFNYLLLFAEGAAEATWFQKYGLYIILAVFIVIMFLTTLIPNRKQKKERENLMANIKPGAKIKTYGGLLGTIVSMNDVKNEVVLNVGTDGNQTLITIVKEAIYTVIPDGTTVATSSQSIEEQAKKDNVALTEDEVAEQLKAEEKAKEKEEKKEAQTVTKTTTRKRTVKKADGVQKEEVKKDNID